VDVSWDPGQQTLKGLNLSRVKSPFLPDVRGMPSAGAAKIGDVSAHPHKVGAD